MQNKNGKIKEEIDDSAHSSAGVASVYIASDPHQQSSSSSPPTQQKVILSPRIEIHRVVKSQDSDIIYDRVENGSPVYEEKNVSNGGSISPDAMQFVTPTCRLAAYREPRSEKPSLLAPNQQPNAMQRVHVIKDGRFYEESRAHYIDLQQSQPQPQHHQQINEIERDHRRSSSPQMIPPSIQQMHSISLQRAIIEGDHSPPALLQSNAATSSPPSAKETATSKQRVPQSRQIIVNPNTVSSSNQPMRPPPPPPPKIKSAPSEEPSSSIPDLGE